MTTRRMLSLLAVIFIATLIWQLPASWALRALPAGTRCEQPGGTAWHGSCGQFSAGQLTVHGLHWDWLGGELLHGRLGALVSVADPQLRASARLLLGTGALLRGEQLNASLPLRNTLLGGTASGLDGQLQINLQHLEVRNGRAVAVGGTVQVHQLASLQPAVSYGDFEWQLTGAPDGRLSGPLRDLRGPLALTGTLALSLRGEYELNAQLQLRAAADPALVQVAELLGPADASGRRTLSVAGTL